MEVAPMNNEDGMPGIILVTDHDAAAVKQSVQKVARRLAYTVAEVGEWEFSLQKGNVIVGVFLGAFFPYCNFSVVIRKNPDATVEIDIERNSPGLTAGRMGLSRVKSNAQELADKIAEDIVSQRGRILRRDTF
jgi:hypothetical protein